MPYVSVWVDEQDLSEVDTDDLIAELESRGCKCTKKGQPLMEADAFHYVSHLLDCGMKQYAAEEALRFIECQLNRPGTLTAGH